MIARSATPDAAPAGAREQSISPMQLDGPRTPPNAHAQPLRRSPPTAHAARAWTPVAQRSVAPVPMAPVRPGTPRPGTTSARAPGSAQQDVEWWPAAPASSLRLQQAAGMRPSHRTQAREGLRFDPIGHRPSAPRPVALPRPALAAPPLIASPSFGVYTPMWVPAPPMAVFAGAAPVHAPLGMTPASPPIAELGHQLAGMQLQAPPPSPAEEYQQG